MDELHLLECRTGPLPEDERWILRFGSRSAYERAQARTAIRQITRACMNAIDGVTLGRLLDLQKIWRSRLRTLA